VLLALKDHSTDLTTALSKRTVALACMVAALTADIDVHRQKSQQLRHWYPPQLLIPTLALLPVKG
jgi:hypothetical protein